MASGVRRFASTGVTTPTSIARARSAVESMPRPSSLMVMHHSL